MFHEDTNPGVMDIAWEKDLQAGNPFFETCIYHNTNALPGSL
ncbi:MAG TPA: hypothetical protein VMU83_12115 [Hanamia sp.]|nr:hypothetical protein [Hanamia sp.]